MSQGFRKRQKNCREVPQRDENRGGLPHKVHGRPDCGRDDGVRHYRRTGRLSVLFLRGEGIFIRLSEKEDSIVFLDETVRTIERGQSTETEFSESMKQRLEKGYILPGQMRELFSCKEILAQINQRRCVAMVALDMKCNQLNIKDRIAIESRTVNPYNNSFELLVKDLKRYKKTDTA